MEVFSRTDRLPKIHQVAIFTNLLEFRPFSSGGHGMESRLL